MVLSGLYAMLWTQKMPLMYYAYVFFPVYFWNQVFKNCHFILETLQSCFDHGVTRSVGFAALAVAFLEALVSPDTNT